MGNRRLLLLVLLASSYTFAQDDVPDNQETTCSKDATRFKHLRKYTYNYEAGTTSGVTGTADSQSGSKISCKVELEVPQPCNFILRTKQCTLREVYGVNSEGKALLKKSKNSEDLSNAMSKYEVKFTVPDGRNVILYPHKDEPLNVLNMKRGILSALLVPDETQESENMDTVYGKCSTKMTVTSRKGNIATDVTIDRKLDSCDKFTPTRDYVSPLALLKGLNAPLSNLISSSQTCQYNIEPKRKHVSEASCVETHMFLPFSYKNQYGMNVKVTQTLKLEDVSKTNNREFDSDPTMAVGLALEAAKSLSKNEDAVLANLMELQKLSTTEQNQQRASGFYKLVTALRDLNNDTLGPLVPKMIQLSSPIALQALTQCGTPECFGGILQVLRSGDVSPVISEAVTYTLGFLPSPCPKRVRELLNMAQYQPSRASFYALSHAVNNLYEDKPQFTPELKDVADFMISLIGNECTENEDKTFLTLKAIGIMGKALEAVSPELKSSLVKCVRSQAPSFEIRKAAIQAFRKMNDIAEVRDALVQAFQETAAPVQNRLAAYLLLMKDPTQTDLRKIIRVLAKEENVEVKTFVASHMKNILDSQELEDQKFKDKIKEALKNNEDLIVSGDNTKVSRNYKFYKSVNVPGLDDSMATKVEGNLIFDTDSSMPKEAMLEATLNVFGQSIDMFEFGVEGKGFEPTLDALFGKSGFFPDTTMKALYWVDGKVPDKVTEVLYKWFGVSRQNNQNKDFTKAVLLNVEKLIKEVRSSDAPEAKAYLDILGKELGYLKLSDFKILGNMLLKTLHTTQELPVKIMQAISKGAESDLFLHYIFMDNEFELPTGSGLQLQVSLSGIIAPGTRAGMKIGSKNMKAELSVKPAVSVEFVTQMGVKIPEFSRHAVIMNSNIYHESGIEAHFSVKDGQFKFSIPAPKAPTKLLSINNKINLVFASKTEVMTSIIENREERSSCKPLLSGLNYCTNVVYSNASSIDGAPYFPLTGEARYDLEIQPTGEVEAYSVTADYKLNREGEDMVDTLTFSTQAEGTKSCEATLTMKYNRNKVILTSDVQIPKFDVDFGVGVKLNEESTESKKLYSVVIDVHNQQVQEGTLTGQLSYDGKGEAVLGAMLSIPRLDTEAKTEATVQYVAQSFKLQLQSSAQICAFSGSQKVVFTYDHDKVELEWNAGTNSNVQKIVSKIPDIRFSDLSNYPETLKKYANDALDYKVAQTDMTMRHIVSQSLVATSNWLRDASKDIPYAVKLHNKLTALQELDLQGLGLPPFPEQLFLNSNGRIKYLLNKDSIIINIPLPYGGKSSEQLMASRSMRSPPVDLPSVGLKFPSQEFKIPAFTIPEYYQLKVPLLGVLELSSNFKSNYYNWSASYVGGNTTTSDVYTFISKYEMQAASILDILSYNIDGSALSSYDPKKTLHLEYTGSVRHSLLDFNIRFSDTWNFQSNQIFKGSHGYDVKSILGVEASVTSTAKTSKNNNIITSELNNHGQYKIASLFANSDYMMMTTFNTDNFQVKTESNFNLDSSYIKIANKMSGLFLAEAITITSTTDVQDGALSNTMTVDYRNRQLSFKSDTNGNYYNLIGMNKFEFTLSKKMAAIRSEYQADYKRNRFYTLLSGSLNSLGLELNADVSLNNQANRAAHKATMIISQDGLSTSATTNVNFSPLTLENEFNAGIGASGATMKMTANGRYREHNAKVTIDGKAALTELSFGSVYQATILGLDSKNVLIFRFSKEGLKFSNNLMGSYEQMRLENNNDLSIADYSIHFNSKFENTLRSGRSYKQDFDLKLQPYTITALLNNEFQFDSLELTNRGQFQLEDLKINLNGNMRGAINKDEVKHSYTSYISYAQMLANLKMDTVANIQGTAHTHTLNMEIAGLSASFSSSSNCETKSMRFTNMVRSVIAPFTVTIDAHTTGDGRLYIYGEHTGQLYSKFILKAEPLSFNLVHDYRGSTGHTFEAGKTHSTLIDYKMNVLFTPSEQLTSWKLKSQLNQNTYTQDLSAYNNPEKVGVELSGQTLADLSILDRQIVLPFSRFNPIDALGLRDSVSQPQEFSISGYVKYDKNKDMHTINLPFIESLSSLFEKLRSVLLTSLQGLHNSLKSVNIDQYIRNYKKTLDKIPQQMNDYINNLDIEGRVNEAKENILSLTKEFKITSEELQIAIERYFKRLQVNLQMYLSEIDNYVRENYNLDQISATIEMLIKQIIEKIKAFEKQYSIREKTVEMIKDLQNFVEQININELGKDLASYIQSLEDTFQIKVKLQKCLQKLQALIQKIDIDQMAENAKQFLQTIEINKYVEQLKNTLPIKHINYAIEQIKNLFITLLEEYEISEKINALIDKLQDIITEYDIDKKLQVLMEKFIQLLNQQKVKETITKITNMLNGIDIKLYFKKLLTFIEDAVKQVKEYNFRNLINDINNNLNVLVRKMKSFNYDKFVDDVNNWIREVTLTLNNKMKALDLPQKAEALKQYMNDVRTVVNEYIQQLKDTKFSSVVQWYQDVMSSTILNELKTRTMENLQDARDRIYSMNIKKECQRYLQQVSQAYNRIVTYISQQWEIIAEKINNFASENNLQELAKNIKTLVEEGFVVPEINSGLIYIPTFEVSLRALKEATFKTPSFVVPLTDLHIPSVEINFKRLKEIEIPTRFVTPEFTVLSTFKVPSYVIDLNEIKLKIVRTIDQITSSDFQWPSPEVYFKDLRMSDMAFPEISFPQIYVPDMQIPEITIPKLNLKNFQFADIQIPEFNLPQIPHTVSVPAFGKFSSSLKVTSPFFTMTTVAEIRNDTISENNPEFVASLSTETTSVMEAVSFTLLADARISAPMVEQLLVKESVLLSNKYVKLDHNSELTFSGSQIQTKAETKANLNTEKNSVEFHNDILLKLQKRITAECNTKYSHRINIPQYDISSQLGLQNEIQSIVEAGRILLISSGKGNWKWACPIFTDEGNHQADLKFNLKGSVIELSGTNTINDKYLKLDQSLKYESALFNYVNVDIISKAESTYVGNSIVSVKGSGQLTDLKLELIANHNAELFGRATGTISNGLSFLVKPFEINFSSNNNGNLKVSFPLKLTGKIEFLNNYNFILNSKVQQVSWQVNGRFNQYKVSHTISAGNNEESVEAVVAMNGEANLDFLTIPISIPQIPVPYTAMKTPEVKEFSLWERTGLKNFLKTTKQNFDLNVKLQYKKNKDMHSIPLPLDEIYGSINSNMKTISKKFEKGRDNVLNILMDSYNQAKVKFDKYKVENSVSKVPRTFRIPGYTIPLVNIEVSPFSAELPAFGYVIPKEISTPSFTLPVLGFSIPTYTLVLPSLELPVLHVPNTLRRLTLPKFKLPSGQNSISIPAMGNLTYDFSFKSNVISVTTSAGLYNQSDISARISVASTSVIDALQFNIDGTTGLTRKRGLKLATALALKTVFIEGKHESSMSLGKRNVEASVTTNGKVNIPLLKLTFNQELTGNTKTKPTLSSKMTLSYDFNDSKYGNNAKGTLDHTLSLESLTSYFSLETVTNGDTTGTLLSNQFSGKFTNEANTYLNSNGVRSSVKLVGSSKVDSFGTLDIAENLAVEATTSRIYAVWEHTGENYLRFTPLFITRGTQNSKATLELALWSLLANLNLKISQPNSYFADTALNQDILLSVNTEKQEFGLNGQGILETIVLSHNFKLSNDKTDARVEVDGSLQGHMDFLKSVILPVYEKSLWDVLKFDLTTSADKKQYLKASTSLIYTKNKEGFFFPIPINKMADGFTITFPALALNNIKIQKKLSTLPFDLSLPSLPQVKFPKIDITTKYIIMEEYKIPFFEVTIPKHQITLARYTLPKSFYNLDFNTLMNKIADIDLPTIEIPEQNIEIPPVKLNLPAGLFIPAFGTLTGSAQLSSPIYNVSWTAKLANSSEGFVASIDATSSSTLRFLEYDLDASASTSLKGSTLSFKGAFAHPDLSADWQNDIFFNGLRMPGHNIEIDIRSPTFTNVQIRCQQENNKMSSTVTCPSVGTLGLVLEKDATTLKGKLFSRSVANPAKDTLIMKSEMSLKNPGKIQNKINWKEDAALDVLNGLKEKLPKMTDAIYNGINKYHKEHLGMEMSDARLKMKESLQNSITSTYRSTANQIDRMEYNLRTAARGAGDKYMDIMYNAQNWYKGPADMPDFMNDVEFKSKFYDKSIMLIRSYQNTMKDLIDAAIAFVKNTQFQLPGQSEKYTGEELFTMGMKKVMSSIEQSMQKIQLIFDKCIQSINDMQLDVPGTDISIQGKQVISAIKNLLIELQRISRNAFADLQNVSLEKILKQLKSLIQEISQESEKIIEALKSRNYQDIKAHAQKMYRDAMDTEYAREISNVADKLQRIAIQMQKHFQAAHEQVSEKLEQLRIYAKALREEYLDPNIVGWSVKYYEIEEKVIQLLKAIIDSLKDLPSKYGINVPEMTENAKEFVIKYYQHASNLVTNKDDQGRQLIIKLSRHIEGNIAYLSASARKFTEERTEILRAKVQDAYGQLVNSYDKFIVEANRLIDLAIEKYNSFIEFIAQLLQNFQNSASDEMKKYVSTRKGELKVDVPHPFDWNSFDEMPQLRSDIVNKRLEIARSMVFDGIDKGSKTWEELQHFIEKQLEDGKLSAQQIIENIRNWKKN